MSYFHQLPGMSVGALRVISSPGNWMYPNGIACVPSLCMGSSTLLTALSGSLKKEGNPKFVNDHALKQEITLE